MLEDKHGRDIVTLDVTDRSEVTDYYILVSGGSPPHLKALCSEVEHALRQDGVRCYRRAGDPESGWLVLDYFDVVIHIFLEETREFYALEELWSGEAPEQTQGMPDDA